MKRITPLLTLLTGLALGAVLLGMSMAATPTAAPPQGAQVAATSPQDPAAGAARPAPTTPQTGPTASEPPPAPDTGAPPAKVNATWAGTVDGGRASIAIAAKDGVAIAYLCDGDRVEAWLRGTARAGTLDLTGKGGAELTGTFGNGKASGVVLTAGKRWTFTAPGVKAPSGLYRATAQVRNASVVGGWIVLADGTQVGVLSTDGAPAPAPPLDLTTGTTTVDGTTITVAPATETG